MIVVGAETPEPAKKETHVTTTADETVPEDDYISLANFCDATIDLIDETVEKLRDTADELSAHAREFRRKLEG